ncbi:hypothetical protein DPMN_021965 [Dreissena polymorpha]|uniref:Uncharacterized protein n=1 Tax=Dreissena polymorpha TaxID=45954 RepID=A0A9D4MKN9_DREPO|nr:hypothetical protein DPMN_079046 [Dreissena polymorpha]KAH3879065.1 hypothetical protein DPMN_002966 [Dreissena polymorpha]KAH3895288.1 hypothetical protein DPMN_019449 [Dreissena polymorpha]KAH3897770.1 hypothetical protein DPMN_021965 [Dreissena polymorpha]
MVSFSTSLGWNVKESNRLQVKVALLLWVLMQFSVLEQLDAQRRFDRTFAETSIAVPM